MAHYRLIGSPTSPYVRRFRLYSDRAALAFDPLADMYGRDDAQLSQINPLKRVPVLLVDGRPLWESRVIFNHLREAFGRRPLSFEEENALSVIDTLQDQLVQMFLMTKNGHPIHQENVYFQRHADRRERMLAYLRAETIAGRFDAWDYPAMSLYCLLDWAEFRGAIKASEIEGPLARFFESSRSQPRIGETDPRTA